MYGIVANYKNKKYITIRNISNMKLIIGGYAQGKLDYVKQTNEKIIVYDCKEQHFFIDKLCNNDGAYTEDEISANNSQNVKNNKNSEKIIVIDRFHCFVRDFFKEYENDKNKDELWSECKKKLHNFIEKHHDMIIISDEIGNGIVPIDPFEREYREKTGRILIELAKQADEVVRVVCGIGQKIK